MIIATWPLLNVVFGLAIDHNLEPISSSHLPPTPTSWPDTSAVCSHFTAVSLREHAAHL